MNVSYRLATPKDTTLLANWWRDGAVMAHAGFPNGLEIDEEKLRERLTKQRENNHQVFIVVYEGINIGEMGVKKKDKEAEIGIKICDQSHQNKGIGTAVLKQLIGNLFDKEGISKIVLDTMVENTRAQKVYERLGFKNMGINHDVFVDQLGRKRSAVLYEMSIKDHRK